MKRVFRMVPRKASEDTLEALSMLTSEAKRGELIGIAYAAMYVSREYVVSAAGEAHRNPTFSLGMIEMLSSAMRSLEEERHGQ